MQDYIIIKPTRGPARLSLGMIGNLPEPWQQTARQLVLRRRMKLGRRTLPSRSWQDSPGAGPQRSVRTFQHIHSW